MHILLLSFNSQCPEGSFSTDYSPTLFNGSSLCSTDEGLTQGLEVRRKVEVLMSRMVVQSRNKTVSAASLEPLSTPELTASPQKAMRSDIIA